MPASELSRLGTARAPRSTCPTLFLASVRDVRALRARTSKRSPCIVKASGAAGGRAAGVGAALVEQLVETAYPTTSDVQHTTSSLRLVAGSCYLPHPAKVSYGGEDAHFISEATQSIGVADGVGGWQESGVNPAEYSRTLMAVACAHLENRDVLDHLPPRILNSKRVQQYCEDPAPAPVPGVADPQGALDVAHRLTRVPGSSTACILQVDDNTNTLVAANVGDSGFMVVRGGERLIMSRPMEHFFDCPLQMGAFPEYVEATDTAADAEVYRIELQAGDVIITGTDGLWDNCYQGELVTLAPKSPAQVNEAARSMALLARGHAEDDEFASPYIKEALQNGYDLPWWEKVMGASWRDGQFRLKELSGGKQDDITVLVAFVSDGTQWEEVEVEEEGPVAAAAVATVVEKASNGAAATAAAATAVVAAAVEAAAAPAVVDQSEAEAASTRAGTNGTASVASSSGGALGEGLGAEDAAGVAVMPPLPRASVGSMPRVKKVKCGDDVELPDYMSLDFCISVDVMDSTDEEAGEGEK